MQPFLHLLLRCFSPSERETAVIYDEIRCHCYRKGLLFARSLRPVVTSARLPKIHGQRRSAPIEELELSLSGQHALSMQLSASSVGDAKSTVPRMHCRHRHHLEIGYREVVHPSVGPGTELRHKDQCTASEIHRNRHA